MRTIFFWGENLMEKTRGGPETAAAEQPKLTTTTTVNRASFHAASSCEHCAKAMAKLCPTVSINIDKGLRAQRILMRKRDQKKLTMSVTLR
jgi:hypothetical protein